MSNKNYITLENCLSPKDFKYFKCSRQKLLPYGYLLCGIVIVENSGNDLLSVRLSPLKGSKKYCIVTSNYIHDITDYFIGLEELLKDEKIMFFQYLNSNYLVHIKYLLISDKETGIDELIDWGEHLGVKQENFIIL